MTAEERLVLREMSLVAKQLEAAGNNFAPNAAKAYRDLGEFFVSFKQYEQAEHCLRIALQIAQENELDDKFVADLMLRFGHTLRSRNHIVAAAAVFRDAAVIFARKLPCAEGLHEALMNFAKCHCYAEAKLLSVTSRAVHVILREKDGNEVEVNIQRID